MAHELPNLPYAHDALEPHIDTRTMEIHHGKHHAAYVANLNNAIAGKADLEAKSAEDLIRDLGAVPDDIRGAVRNNGGGHVNHSLFWTVMGPNAGGAPSGDLAAAIDAAFGGFDAFKDEFKKAAMTRFGSGWAWLVDSGDGALAIQKTPNADLPLAHDTKALLTIDVWEHAYYIDFRNRRPDYIDTFLTHLVNWDFVNQNLQ